MTDTRVSHTRAWLSAQANHAEHLLHKIIIAVNVGIAKPGKMVEAVTTPNQAMPVHNVMVMLDAWGAGGPDAPDSSTPQAWGDLPNSIPGTDLEDGVSRASTPVTELFRPKPMDSGECANCNEDAIYDCTACEALLCLHWMTRHSCVCHGQRPLDKAQCCPGKCFRKRSGGLQGSKPCSKPVGHNFIRGVNSPCVCEDSSRVLLRYDSSGRTSPSTLSDGYLELGSRTTTAPIEADAWRILDLAPDRQDRLTENR